MTTITTRELQMLKDIYNDQNTDSCGNYKVETDEQKGLIGSLVKKDLIYDSYEGYTFGKMWQFTKYSFCCTDEGIKLLEDNGFNTSDLKWYYELYS